MQMMIDTPPVHESQVHSRRLRQLTRENLILKARLARALCESRRDALTGLYNRRHFELSMKRMLRERVATGERMGVLFIDADHFKQINDRFGHDVGDVALRHLSRVISSTVGVQDIVCRYGGEEFAILLSDVNDDEPQHTAERIRKAVELNPLQTPAGELSMTVSIGASALPVQTDEGFLMRLVKSADDAVYLAKANGRNRVEVQS